jgi:predicted metalloprotease
MNRELAADCYTITKPPLGIYKHLYRPAKGIESWHLTAIQLQAPLASANTLTSPLEEHRAGTSLPYTYEHGTPYPSYTLCEPIVTRPLLPVELTLHLRLTYNP